MKLGGLWFDKSAKDKQWGFTAAALPRFKKGSDTGVLICHGFGGSPANMRCLADKAEELGFTYTVPLLRGHAATLGDMAGFGREDWREDVSKAYDELVSAGCKRIILCGLSMGALLMAELAAKHKEDGRLAGLFIMCPPVRMKAYLNFSACIAPLAPYVLTAQGFNSNSDMEMYFGMASRKLWDIIALGKAVKKTASQIKCPALIIEAERDNRVAPVTYRILKKRMPTARHIIMLGAPHGIPYSPSAGELTGIFAEFLEERTAADNEKRGMRNS